MLITQQRHMPRLKRGHSWWRQLFWPHFKIASVLLTDDNVARKTDEMLWSVFTKQFLNSGNCLYIRKLNQILMTSCDTSLSKAYVFNENKPTKADEIFLQIHIKIWILYLHIRQLKKRLLLMTSLYSYVIDKNRLWLTSWCIQIPGRFVYIENK